MITRPNTQLCVISTAGWLDEAPFLWEKIKRGRLLVPSRVAYFEWSAEDDADPEDPATWWSCMPALGHTITEDSIRGELDGMALPDFRRAYLNQWVPKPVDADVAVLDMVTWHASADPESAAVDPVTFALEVGDDREWSCVSVGGKRADGLWHGAVVDYRRGTEWVVDRAAELWRKWSPSAFVIDPSSPAGSLIPLLEARGVVVTKVTTREVSQACGQFYDFVRQGDFRHRDDPALNVAVRSATRRTTGDLWRFERRSSTDISPLLSVVIALWVASRERVPLADADLLQTFH
jgi:hypothetical protein